MDDFDGNLSLHLYGSYGFNREWDPPEPGYMQKREIYLRAAPPSLQNYLLGFGFDMGIDEKETRTK